MKRLDEFDIYRIAGSLADAIWKMCAKWDSFPRAVMGKQTCQAADSIPANIAEGFGRYRYKENLMFFYFARGSLEETRNWLARARSRCLITQKEFEDLDCQAGLLARRLNAYIDSIRPFAYGQISQTKPKKKEDPSS